MNARIGPFVRGDDGILRGSLSWESLHGKDLHRGIGVLLADFYGVLKSVIPVPGKEGPRLDRLDADDTDVAENAAIEVLVTLPPKAALEAPARRAVIMLHGLNEKAWQKYDPWADELCLQGDCAVLRFPLAFHMGRAPHSWSDRASMIPASRLRTKREGLSCSSMVNVALSTRLEDSPERLFCSGLQSTKDLLDLVEAVRSGLVPGLAADAEIAFFGYSIGGFLLQCLRRMPAAMEATGHPRMAIFCAGPAMKDMTPVNKFIMDSKAHEALIAYWVGKVRERIAPPGTFRDALLGTGEGNAFLEMVDPSYVLPDTHAEPPETLRCLAFERDNVMPLEAVRAHFSARPETVEVLQLLPESSHEKPFPEGPGSREAVALVMGKAAAHLFG